jgi:branched-chain amino acid transport system ATP-binding protein
MGRRSSSAEKWQILQRCQSPDLTMLAVEKLVVNYGPVEAVRGITFAVKQGEIAALLGANGAGKSSTLAAIVGLVKPASGTITYGGKSITGFPPETLSRLGIGLVPEGRRIFASLSVAENLWLGGASHLSTADRKQRQAEMEDRFPILRERTQQKAGLLSGGEQQMLAIARALMAKPRLLLLDEPSLGLAPQMVEKVFDLIASLRSEGLTILLVEQNVPMSLAIADHGVVLANGRVAMTGTGAELSRDSKISDAYLAA